MTGADPIAAIRASLGRIEDQLTRLAGQHPGGASAALVTRCQGSAQVLGGAVADLAAWLAEQDQRGQAGR